MRPSLLVAYGGEFPSTGSYVGVLDVDAGRSVILAQTPIEDTNPAWNPDGTRLLFRTFVSYERSDLTVLDWTTMERFHIQTDSVLGKAPGMVDAPAGIPRAFNLDYDAMWMLDSENAPQFLGSGLEPQLSPDGQRLAYFLDDPFTLSADVFVLDLKTGERLNVSNHPDHDWSPTWSPDGGEIAFVSARDGNAEIYVSSAVCDQAQPCGSDARRLTFTPEQEADPSWSPDGRAILYQRAGHLFMQNVDSGEARQLTSGTSHYQAPAMRP